MTGRSAGGLVSGRPHGLDELRNHEGWRNNPPNTNSNGIGDMFLLVKGAKHGLIKGEAQDTQLDGSKSGLVVGMQGKPSLGGAPSARPRCDLKIASGSTPRPPR